MKIDETFESVGRLWEQMSVIVLLHAVFLIMAITAGVFPAHRAVMEIRGVPASGAILHMKTFRSTLQGFGLDLPLVTGVLTVIYVVLFQRLSASIGQLPLFRLAYTQPELWRAGKCFDELRQLIHCFEGYTASSSLEDLEVTVGVAIAQFRERYSEHYEELVGLRMAKAAMWSRYHSGVCLMGLCSIAVVVAVGSSPRIFLLPLGLFAAALITRIGWECQIEHACLGRLRFALNCAVIFEAEKAAKVPRMAPKGEVNKAPDDPVITTDIERVSPATFDNLLWNVEGYNDMAISGMESPYLMPLRASRMLLADLGLAANLVKLPPPYLPYQRNWLLFYARSIWPLRQVGALAFVRNEKFRAWVIGIVRQRFDQVRIPQRREWAITNGMEEAAIIELQRRIDEQIAAIKQPHRVPDESLIARFLWIEKRLCPTWLLADTRENYDATRVPGDSRLQSRLPKGTFRGWEGW